MKGPEGWDDSLHYVKATNKMQYRINFENDPDFATAPASRVMVRYPMPPNHNRSSFRLGNFGFADYTFTVPSRANYFTQRIDLSDSMGIWLDVTAGLDMVNNEAFWIFQTVDPATGFESTNSQMGFLAINDSLHSGEGYVTFNIDPVASVTSGDTVAAEAVIVFDENESINTNVFVNHFDAIAPTSELHATRSADDTLTYIFSATNHDDPQGSGVDYINILRSSDDGSYEAVAVCQPDSSVAVLLAPGMTYKFMAQAVDHVGNQEPLKQNHEVLIDFNEAPDDIDLDNTFFLENTPLLSAIGTLSTTDKGRLQRYRYELVQGQGDADNQYFAIQADKLVLNANLQCSGRFEYSVRVRAIDQGGLFTERSFDLAMGQQNYPQTKQLRGYVCQGSSYTFGNHSLDTAGIYVDSLQTTRGCDSIVMLTLNVRPSYNQGSDTLVCRAQPFKWDGHRMDTIYPSADTLLLADTLYTSFGCDSICRLALYTRDVAHTQLAENVCDNYLWHDTVTITESTILTDTLRTTIGCDSIVALNLTLHHSSSAIDSLVACDSYMWQDSIVYTASTNEPTKLFQNTVGCDSTLTLHLTINSSTAAVDSLVACDSYMWQDSVVYTASTTEPIKLFQNAVGCDSTLTLHLTINSSTAAIDSLVACDSYMWQDSVVYTASTTEPTKLFQNAVGCDSTLTLHLTINNSTAAIDSLVACDSYMWQDSIVYTASTNEPTKLFQNAVGCDSTLTLHLTINSSTAAVDSLVACDSYMWQDSVVYTASTTEPTKLFQNAVGCDSTLTLHLTINNSTAAVDSLVACDSYMWQDSVVYTASTNEPTKLFQNAVGCDSTLTLHLTINNSTAAVDSLVVCDSYMWQDSVVYTASTTEPTKLFQNAVGCDSTLTLHLTINSSTAAVDSLVACDSYMWQDSVVYTASTNEPIKLFQNAVGCDSTLTLHLTINNSTAAVDSLVACDSYMWQDSVVYTASTNEPTKLFQNAVGCDSTLTLHLTINSSTAAVDSLVACDSYMWQDSVVYTASTNEPTKLFQNAVGCDSTLTLHLTINNSTAAVDSLVACDSYMWQDSVVYTASTNEPTKLFQNAAGCDSTLTLHLTINNSTAAVDSLVVCDSYMWQDSVVYTASTTEPTKLFQNAVGCDSTLTLHLTINSSTAAVDSLVACDSYMWQDSVVYTASTNEPTKLFQNAVGCDSTLTLHLTINNSTAAVDSLVACDNYMWQDSVVYTASTTEPTKLFQNAVGCDSTLTLHLTINNSTAAIDSLVACDSYMWQDSVTYTASTNEPTKLFQNAVGCDSTLTLHLTINSSTAAVDSLVACDSYMWQDSVVYTASTTEPTKLFQNAVGCDSTLTLHLTINSSTAAVDSLVACDSYVWQDSVVYTASTTEPTKLFQNAVGCDSTLTLHLTINNSTAAVDSLVACDSLTWYNGITYRNSIVTADTLVNAVGCDSVNHLLLTVNYTTADTTQQVACDSLLWLDGNTYYSTITTTDTLTNLAGCDSLRTLLLTVNRSVRMLDSLVACDSLLWHGTLFRTSATATDTLATTTGCDSIVDLQLTINRSVRDSMIYNICAGDTFYFDTLPLTTAGSYRFDGHTVQGCDSTMLLTLNVDTATYAHYDYAVCDSVTWEGVTYTRSLDTSVVIPNMAGCDSVVSLHLVVNYSSRDTLIETATGSYTLNGETYTESGEYELLLQSEAGCDSVIVLQLTITQGIDAVAELENLKLYPNPTTGKITLSADKVLRVEVYDNVGRLLRTYDESREIDLSAYGAGSYTLRILLPQGQALRKVVLMK